MELLALSIPILLIGLILIFRTEILCGLLNKPNLRPNFKRAGYLSSLVGTVFTVCAFLTLFGPNPLAAMDQAKEYLSSSYGESGSFGARVTPEKTPEGESIIHYSHAGRSGILYAKWNGESYDFREETASVEQDAAPNR